jgi:hypothetical protein
VDGTGGRLIAVDQNPGSVGPKVEMFGGQTVDGGEKHQ